MPPTDSCFVFAPGVCIAWDAGFQFWEIIVTSALAVLVTIFTIRASVNASAEATQKTLDAAKTAEDAARADRQVAHSAQEEASRRREAIEAKRLIDDQRRRDHQMRLGMGQSMAETAVRVEQAAGDPEELEVALDAWRNVGIAFRSSPLEEAPAMFDYADHVVDDSIATLRDRTRPRSFINEFAASTFARDLAEVIVSWIKTGALPDSAISRLEQMRSDRSAREAKESDGFRMIWELLSEASTFDASESDDHNDNRPELP